MRRSLLGEVRELLLEARTAYADDDAAIAALATAERRLDEPLRVALAGMVKAGKSTLLNAVLGEELAATDAGECTRIVTWYRHGHTPRVTLFRHDGSTVPLRVRRDAGRLVFGLEGVPEEEIERLEVEWPAESLKALTLIDTPGIASLSTDVSARSNDFLLPHETPPEADAILYLLRHLHESDVDFLRSFRSDSAAGSSASTALAVLSRADEVGSGRIDSLMSAREIARRYGEDPGLRPLVSGVVPVAGLLAQAARTLRQSEFAALAELAALDRRVRQRLLLSADRFVAGNPIEVLDPEMRAALLDRFGLFGIRLATVLIGNGFADSTALAHELARRSGLDQLLRLVSERFSARADALKARTALAAVTLLLRRSPREEAGGLELTIERITAGAHEIRELAIVPRLRPGTNGLTPAQTAEAERLLGARGGAAALRLGLPATASAAELRRGARDALERWRALADRPFATVDSRTVGRAVVRSCEGLLAPASGADHRLRLALRPEPASGSRDQAEDQRHAG